ncbi:Uncharacterised protein [Burkholderia pseudomallei]|nr:Uncharacterised protein [Burkholderia pseudomallei]CAJ6797311.1 Uncharacterised protein [Burkholderia pseudomallei]CAJ7362750.1 Uncharacterised protein [Burkholderia pseudomallei]VBJ87740.1 Uncharacterised protein [Burkholderia pseudomallei]VBU04472.1 Uncharacterised protein [Burkholderia pseudomallei]
MNSNRKDPRNAVQVQPTHPQEKGRKSFAAASDGLPPAVVEEQRGNDFTALSVESAQIGQALDTDAS